MLRPPSPAIISEPMAHKKGPGVGSDLLQEHSKVAGASRTALKSMSARAPGSPCTASSLRSEHHLSQLGASLAGFEHTEEAAERGG